LIEVVLSLKTAHTWIKEITENYSATVKINSCKPGDGECGTEELVEISGSEEILDDVIESMNQNKLIRDFDIVKVGKGRVFGLIKTSSCLACRIFTESKCFLTSARTSKNGYVEYTLILRGLDQLKSVLERLADRGFEVEINKVTRTKVKEVLTHRQEQIIQSAFQAGYFDYPKRTTLAELAESLNITPSTLLEILRRSQRRVMAEYLRH
jgi:predicted DNA binding protein